MIKEYFELNFDNGKVKGDLRYNKGSKMPFIFFFHGFKVFRNWGFIPYICDKLALHNYNVINIDYSKNGIIDSDKLIYDSETFANQTISSHFQDCQNIYQYVCEENFINDVNIRDIWDGRIFCIGHSMGGALSYLLSSKVHIDKIVSLAAVSQFERNTERQKLAWRERGFTEIRMDGSEQILKLNYSYVDDKEKNFPQNIVLESINKYKGKYLVIQAQNDMVAKLTDAKQLYDAGSYKDNKELFVIEGTGHTFSASHPLNGENKYLRSLVNKTLDFFNED